MREVHLKKWKEVGGERSIWNQKDRKIEWVVPLTYQTSHRHQRHFQPSNSIKNILHRRKVNYCLGAEISLSLFSYHWNLQDSPDILSPQRNSNFRHTSTYSNSSNKLVIKNHQLLSNFQVWCPTGSNTKLVKVTVRKNWIFSPKKKPLVRRWVEKKYGEIHFRREKYVEEESPNKARQYINVDILSSINQNPVDFFSFSHNKLSLRILFLSFGAPKNSIIKRATRSRIVTSERWKQKNFRISILLKRGKGLGGGRQQK